VKRGSCRNSIFTELFPDIPRTFPRQSIFGDQAGPPAQEPEKAYIKIPAAVETFSESTFAAISMVTSRAHRASQSARKPVASFPKTKTVRSAR
jgi:hypothetical protein